MSKPATIDVEPIWGNGWWVADAARDVSAPFLLVAEPWGERGWSGRIVTPGHEFEGRIAKMTPSFTTTSEFFALEIDAKGDAAPVVGYGKVAPRWGRP
jgi:hypothetical protein